LSIWSLFFPATQLLLSKLLDLTQKFNYKKVLRKCLITSSPPSMAPRLLPILARATTRRIWVTLLFQNPFSAAPEYVYG
jgi:hypothetical protein